MNWKQKIEAQIEWDEWTENLKEIKRLQAELRLRKDEYVERQEWAAEQATAVIKEKDAEIERLRAALEEIAGGDIIDSDCWDIAREALKDE